MGFVSWANRLDRRVLKGRMSRYGGYVWWRLDEDIDALKRRIAELEARVERLEN